MNFFISVGSILIGFMLGEIIWYLGMDVYRKYKSKRK